MTQENSEFRINEDTGVIEQWKGGEWVRSVVNDIITNPQHGTWTETTDDASFVVFKGKE